MVQNHVPALEVCDAITNTWHSVVPPQDTVLINLGDLAAYWSNGLFKSTPHRVENLTDMDRYSIAFFCNTDYEAEVIPIARDDETEHDTVVPMKPILAGHYIQDKLGLMYKKANAK